MAPSATIFLSFSFLFCFFLLVEAQTSPPISVRPEDPDAEIKCGSCPCSNPCVQQLPPPPPPDCNPALPPPPPSPRFIYTTFPSPPPSPRFIYTTGVPGNLYQIDTNNRWYYFSGVAGKRPAMAALVVAVGCGALELIVFDGRRCHVWTDSWLLGGPIIQRFEDGLVDIRLIYPGVRFPHPGWIVAVALCNVGDGGFASLGLGFYPQFVTAVLFGTQVDQMFSW